MNGQVFAFKNVEFLAVSATHGIAHLALFSQSMWDKYQLAKLTEGEILIEYADRREGKCFTNRRYPNRRTRWPPGLSAIAVEVKSLSS